MTAPNRQPFVSTDPTHSFRDGLTGDTQGRIWVALWGRSAVHRYSASRALEDVIEVATEGDGLHL